MSFDLYKDVVRICVESVSIFFSGSKMHGLIITFHTNFSDPNEVCGLSKRFSQRHLLCSARENVNHPFLNPFKKEAYVMPSSKSRIRTASWSNLLAKSARDSNFSCLIFKRRMLVSFSFLLKMN